MSKGTSADTSFPVDYIITKEGRIIPPPSSLMSFQEFWDRESEYKQYDVVLDKGKTYICIQDIAGVKNVLAPGFLQQGAVVDKGSHGVPEGVLIPNQGLIVPGVPTSGILSRSDPRWVDGNDSTMTSAGIVAQAWEFRATSPGGIVEVKAAVTLLENEAGELVKKSYESGGPPPNWEGHPGWTKLMMVNDVQENREGFIVNHEFLFWDGTTGQIPKAKINLEEGGSPPYGNPGPEKVFFLVVSGAIEAIPGPPFGNRRLTLPMPYEFLLEGPHLVTAPGNLEPSKDPEHWIAI